jgi:hypothetical protein
MNDMKCLPCCIEFESSSVLNSRQDVGVNDSSVFAFNTNLIPFPCIRCCSSLSI